MPEGAPEEAPAKKRRKRVPATKKQTKKAGEATKKTMKKRGTKRKAIAGPETGAETATTPGGSVKMVPSATGDASGAGAGTVPATETAAAVPSTQKTCHVRSRKQAGMA
jgi:hypothetical protein